MRLVVEKLDDDATKIGLTREAIQAAAESRLRDLPPATGPVGMLVYCGFAGQAGGSAPDHYFVLCRVPTMVRALAHCRRHRRSGPAYGGGRVAVPAQPVGLRSYCPE